MKATVIFEEGALHLSLTPETDAEKRMIGAVLEQPQGEEGSAYLDKSLLAASMSYGGHWTARSIERLRLSVYRPNAKQE